MSDWPITSENPLGDLREAVREMGEKARAAPVASIITDRELRETLNLALQQAEGKTIADVPWPPEMVPIFDGMDISAASMIAMMGGDRPESLILRFPITGRQRKQVEVRAALVMRRARMAKRRRR